MQTCALPAADFGPSLSPLKALEAQSIHLPREAVAEETRPKMLYSMGKDSTVMLQLARKVPGGALRPGSVLRTTANSRRSSECCQLVGKAHLYPNRLIMHT